MSDKNIYERLNDVQAELIKSGVGKHGKAPQIMGGYAFTKADDVFDRISDLLVDNGICYIPSVRENDLNIIHSDTEKGARKFNSRVLLEIIYVNTDNPNDKVAQYWSGEAIDNGDKSTQKAITSAVKYALIKKFMIGDNEEETEEFIDDANQMLATIPAIRIERPENKERSDIYDKIFNVLGEDKATNFLLKICEKEKVESTKYIPLETYKKISEKVGD